MGKSQSLLAQLRPYEVDRALHVNAVAATCEVLAQHEEDIPKDVLVSAALLHDIGYAPDLQRTGQHSIDGALYLRSVGFDERTVSLVAHHSGAAVEASERGLVAELDDFPAPDPILADALTAADMSVGPAGDAMDVESRLAEVLDRYPATSVVHRAVTRTADELRAAHQRAYSRAALS